MKINAHLAIKGKKILIIGNRSYKNLGDELIVLWTTKTLLQQKDPKECPEITISCFNPQRLKKFFSQFFTTNELSKITFIHELPKGVRSAFYWLKNWGIKELKQFWQTDTIILWGGEILTEESPSAYRYRLVSMRPFLVAKCFHKKKYLYIMGGVQTPASPRKLKLLKFLLNRTTHLYLRDTQSVNEIKKLGYQNAEFFMDTSYFAYDWTEKTQQSTKDKYIIVNLNKNGEQFIESLISDISKYLKQGYTVYYVPVAKGANQYYQDIHYKKILEKKLNHHLETLDREEDFNHFVQLLKGAEIVISTRLHLFLIASFLRIPTKVYPYQKKIVKMKELISSLPISRSTTLE